MRLSRALGRALRREELRSKVLPTLRAGRVVSKSRNMALGISCGGLRSYCVAVARIDNLEALECISAPSFP